MRIFVSSVVGGMEQAREAAAGAIRALGHEPVRAEDYGARPDTPQRACLKGVRDAEAVVLLLDERYGRVQDSGLSPTHEEYREARETRRPVLAFIQDGAQPEPDQASFIQEVRDWESGSFTENYSDTGQLQQRITQRLHEHLISRAAGSVDEGELLSRASSIVPDEPGVQNPALSLVVAGGPRQTVLSPTALEDPDLEKELIQQASLGDDPIFDLRKGTNQRQEIGALVLEQEMASILVDEEGSIRIVQPVSNPDPGNPLSSMVVIEEDVHEGIERGIKLGVWILGRIDSVQRLSDVAVVATLFDAETKEWRTREENRNNTSGAVQVGMGRSGPIEARLSPPIMKRAALHQQATGIASDLTVLLRRKMKS